MRVLIGYASEHGSTRGIAERIAAGLTEHGHLADVRAVGKADDAAGYDAFVLGSAVHGGEWLPDAAAFLRANQDTLATRPVRLFSVGLARALGGRAEKAAKEPEAVTAIRRTVRPGEHRHLAGAIERDHIPFIGRAVFRMMGGRWGDFRDWNEIDAWAREIADDLGRLLGPQVPHPRRRGSAHL